MNLFLFAVVLTAIAVPGLWAQSPDWADYPEPIRKVLTNCASLEHPRGDRLPLLLWPVHGGVVQDDALQERIIRDLDARGIAMIATWSPSDKDKSLADSLRIARIQQKLGLEVCVNANACMYGFFNGDEDTAYIDAEGKPFFDESISGAQIGCPFRIDHRYPEMTERIDFFVRGYKDAGVPLDFVFGDWEIDGPLDVNRAWEAARKCVVTRKHVPGVDDFATFQEAVRIKRAEATRVCYTEPILSRYPRALVGNYAVYPHNGERYWYDYFEQFVPEVPHRLDQRAPYRTWYKGEFKLSGYTFAMPVCYTWARTFDWYDFANTDYRWFYNLLLVASNAGAQTPATVPIIPFVHWNTVFHPDKPAERIKQLSEQAYREFLWHALLRGSDTFFLWCPAAEAEQESAPLHAVWAEALQYGDWLDRGVPISFDVPAAQGPVVSGLRVGERVLVRRTDFDSKHPQPVVLEIDGRRLIVPPATGRCQLLELE